MEEGIRRARFHTKGGPRRRPATASARQGRRFCCMNKVIYNWNEASLQGVDNSDHKPHLQSWQECSRWSHALQTLQELGHFIPVSSRMTCNSVISACDKGSRWSQAFWFLGWLNGLNPLASSQGCKCWNDSETTTTKQIHGRIWNILFIHFQFLDLQESIITKSWNDWNGSRRWSSSPKPSPWCGAVDLWAGRLRLFCPVAPELGPGIVGAVGIAVDIGHLAEPGCHGLCAAAWCQGIRPLILKLHKCGLRCVGLRPIFIVKVSKCWWFLTSDFHRIRWRARLRFCRYSRNICLGCEAATLARGFRATWSRAWCADCEPHVPWLFYRSRL